MGKRSKFSKHSSITFKLVDTPQEDADLGTKTLMPVPPKKKKMMRKLEQNPKIVQLAGEFAGPIEGSNQEQLIEEEFEELQRDFSVEVEEGEEGDNLFVIKIDNEKEAQEPVDEEVMEALEGGQGFEDLDDSFVVQLAGGREELKKVKEEVKSKIKKTKKEAPAVQAPRRTEVISLGDDDEDAEEVEEADDDDDEYEDIEDELEFNEDDDEEEDDEDDEDDDDEESGARKKKGAKLNVNKQYLNQKFEQVMKQYEDDNIGELDEENPEAKGNLKLRDIRDIVDEYLQFSDKHIYNFENMTEERTVQLSEEILGELDKKAPEGMMILRPGMNKKNKNDVTKEEIVQILKERLKNSQEQDEKEEYEFVEIKQKEKWDCESITSTYSNLYNHPTLIREEDPRKKKKQLLQQQQPQKQIILSSKTGMPIGYLPTTTKKKEEDTKSISSALGSTASADLSKRPENETKEQKKQRKLLVKEQKRQKREQKKALKQAFKSEEVHQQGLAAQPLLQQKVVLRY